MSYPDPSDLVEVNRAINNDSRYINDHTQYGVVEYWTDIRITGDGDCEDYGIAKALELIARHWPIKCLRLAKCWVPPFDVIDPKSGLVRPATRDERYHGVLAVDVPGESDSTILCNRLSYPTHFRLTGYEMDLIQIAGTPTMERVTHG